MFYFLVGYNQDGLCLVSPSKQRPMSAFFFFLDCQKRCGFYITAVVLLKKKGSSSFSHLKSHTNQVFWICAFKTTEMRNQLAQLLLVSFCQYRLICLFLREASHNLVIFSGSLWEPAVFQFEMFWELSSWQPVSWVKSLFFSWAAAAPGLF